MWIFGIGKSFSDLLGARDFGLIILSHRLSGEVPVEKVVSTMAEAVKYIHLRNTNLYGC